MKLLQALGLTILVIAGYFAITIVIAGLIPVIMTVLIFVVIFAVIYAGIKEKGPD